MVPSVLVPQEEWTANVYREASRLINLVGILALVHKRPEAEKFLAYLGTTLAPRQPRRS